jgi:hypothetical protein
MTPAEAMNLISKVSDTIEAMTQLMMVHTERLKEHHDQLIDLSRRVNTLTREVNRINETTIQFSKS